MFVPFYNILSYKIGEDKAALLLFLLIGFYYIVCPFKITPPIRRTNIAELYYVREKGR